MWITSPVTGGFLSHDWWHQVAEIQQWRTVGTSSTHLQPRGHGSGKYHGVRAYQWRSAIYVYNYHPVIKGGHDKIRYQKVLMGKTSLGDGFSSKPCLITRRYDKVGPPQSLHIITLWWLGHARSLTIWWIQLPERPSYLVGKGTEFANILDAWKAQACNLQIEPAQSKSSNIIRVAAKMLVMA